MNQFVALFVVSFALAPCWSQEHEQSSETGTASHYETIMACGIITAIAIVQACTEPHKALPSLAQKILCAITGTCCAELVQTARKDFSDRTLYEGHVEF